MIDRLDRTESHRNRGKLPEIRHQPRVRIRTQTTAGFQLAAKVFQLLFRDAAFEIGASINSRRGVALEINEVAVAAFGLRLKEMIESDLVQRCRRGEGGDVAADAFLNLVGTHHHGQRVPAHQALDAAFHLLAAGERRLLRRRQSCSGREWSRKKEDSLRRRGARAAPVAAAGAPLESARLWTAHSPVSRPTLAFLIPLDRQFPSEPRLISPSDDAEHSMIFNYAEFCWPLTDRGAMAKRSTMLTSAWMLVRRFEMLRVTLLVVVVVIIIFLVPRLFDGLARRSPVRRQCRA